MEKYLHKIKTVFRKMIEPLTDKNEIKTISLKVTEQEFCITQIKKSIKHYKKQNLDFSPKNSEVLSGISKSGSRKKETKNTENNTKSEADIKSNSNYSSSNTPYFSLPDPELSPDYFKTLTEKTEINTNEKLKLLGQQYDAAKSIISEFLSAQQVLQCEFISRNLPPIELKRFDGNPKLWPEFIENFYSRVHQIASFDNNLKMDSLLNVTDGDTKRSIQSIGSSGILYVAPLKALKRDYGNPIIVSHLHVKSLFEFPPIKNNDRIGLPNSHPKLRITIG